MCKTSVKRFERPPAVCAAWKELKETRVECRRTKDEEEGDEAISETTRRKRGSDASPAKFLLKNFSMKKRMGFFLAVLQEIMQLQAKAKDDKVGFQKIVQHLFMNSVKPTQSKRRDQCAGACIEPLLLGLIDGMQQVLKDVDFLGQAQEMVKTAIKAHEESKNTELGESRPGRRVSKKGGPMGARVAVNMLARGESFVGEARNARRAPRSGCLFLILRTSIIAFLIFFSL